jgi:hypothetical protein
MANSNGVVYAPVSFADVNYVLATAHTDLGQLCRDGNINRWAKYKPVGKNKISTLDEMETDKTWKSTATWWKGNTSITTIPVGTTFLNKTNQYTAAWITICGVKYLGFSAKIDVLNIFNVANNHWVTQQGGIFAQNFSHVPPAGGTNEPYRLTDFNYYKHDAHFAGFTDYMTSQGITYINVNDTTARHYACSITNYAPALTLTFNEVFAALDANASFEVVVGKLNDNMSINSVANPTHNKSTNSGTMFDTIYFETLDSGYSYLGIYCMVVNGYYVPLMQSGGDTPNLTFDYQPGTLAWKIWRLGTGVNNKITIQYKTNYANSYANVAKNVSFGNCQYLYFKMTITNDTNSAMMLKEDSFKIEFGGRFTNRYSSTNQVYYQFYHVGSPSTRFVTKTTDVTTAADWGTSEQVVIPPGTTGTCYLACYNVLHNEAEDPLCDVTYGGTVDRISIWLKNTNSGDEFPAIPIAVFGDMFSTSGKLNISISAL